MSLAWMKLVGALLPDRSWSALWYFRQQLSKIAPRSGIPLSGIIQQDSNFFVLVDYYYISYLRGIGKKNQLGIKHGDRKSFSIAAASILTKIHRDKIIRSLSRNPRYKKYLWGKTKVMVQRFILRIY